MWGGGESDERLPLVEIAAIGGLDRAETCHVVLHELAHCADAGERTRQGMATRRARWVCCSRGAIAPTLRSKLQAIPAPTERAPAEYYDWHRRPCGMGYGSRYLKVVCQHPGCGYQVRITRKWLALGAPRCPRLGGWPLRRT